jgi:hypothetical protein
MAINPNDIALIHITLVDSVSKIHLEEHEGGGVVRITTSMEIPEPVDIKDPYYSFPFHVMIDIKGFDEAPDKGNLVFHTSCRVKGLFEHKDRKKISAKDIEKERIAYAELLYVWGRAYIDNQLNLMNITGLNLPWHFDDSYEDRLKKSLLSKKKTKKKTKKKKVSKKTKK